MQHDLYAAATAVRLRAGIMRVLRVNEPGRGGQSNRLASSPRRVTRAGVQGRRSGPSMLPIPPSWLGKELQGGQSHGLPFLLALAGP